MPTLTKAAADAELVERAEGWLTLATWSTAVDGTNPRTVGPLRFGLSSLSLGTATPGVVVDADLSGVGSGDWDQLYDLAELQLKRNLMARLGPTLFNQTVGEKSQELASLQKSLEAEITRLEERVKMLYGHGLGKISAGSIDLGFATTDPWQTERLYPYWN